MSPGWETCSRDVSLFIEEEASVLLVVLMREDYAVILKSCLEFGEQRAAIPYGCQGNFKEQTEAGEPLGHLHKTSAAISQNPIVVRFSF